MKNLVLILIGTLVLAGCSPSKHTPPGDPASKADDLKSFIRSEFPATYTFGTRDHITQGDYYTPTSSGTFSKDDVNITLQGCENDTATCSITIDVPKKIVGSAMIPMRPLFNIKYLQPTTACDSGHLFKIKEITALKKEFIKSGIEAAFTPALPSVASSTTEDVPLTMSKNVLFKLTLSDSQVHKVCLDDFIRASQYAPAENSYTVRAQGTMAVFRVKLER